MKSSSPDDGMTFEEKRRLFFERLDSDYYFKRVTQPQVPVVSLPVTEAVAQLAKANREGVALIIRRDDGVTTVARPQSNTLGLGVTVTFVAEVDEDGLPIWKGRA